jgi:hypothetical protein
MNDHTDVGVIKALKAKIDHTIHIIRTNQGNLDSGASVWMTPNVHCFDVIEHNKSLGDVELADGKLVPVKGIGHIDLVLPNGKIRRINNALYVPDLAETLASVYSIIGDSGDVVCFSRDGVTLENREANECVVIGRRVGDLYYLLASSDMIDASSHDNGQLKALTARQPSKDGEIFPTEVMESPLNKVLNVASTTDEENSANGTAKLYDEFRTVTVSPNPATFYESTTDPYSTSAERALSNPLYVTVHELADLHRRFGHIHVRNILQTGRAMKLKMPKIADDAVNLVNSSIIENCVICSATKMVREPIYSTQSPATKRNHTLWSDTVAYGKSGPWWQIIVDGYSAYIWIYFLKRKSDATDSLIRHIEMIENEYGDKVVEIRMDFGELITTELQNYCKSKIPSIAFKPAPAHVKELDGLSERNIRTIKQMARAMLKQSGLPSNIQFKHYAHLYAATVKNRVVHSRTGTIPLVAYTGKMNDLASIHTFGTLVSIYIPESERVRRRIEDRSELGTFLGYKGEDLRIKIVLNFRTNQIREYFHIKFHEGTFVGARPSRDLLDLITEQFPMKKGIYIRRLPTAYESDGDDESDMPASTSFEPLQRDAEEGYVPYYHMEAVAPTAPVLPVDEYNFGGGQIDHDENHLDENHQDYDQDDGMEPHGIYEEPQGGYEQSPSIEFEPQLGYFDVDVHPIVDPTQDNPYARELGAYPLRNRGLQAKRKRNNSSSPMKRTKRRPIIDWSLKAKSATPDVPIPLGQNRTVPNDLREALSRPDEVGYWLAAMFDENAQLVNAGTWEESVLPKGKNLLSGKWVYDYKLDNHGNILRFKARWVARGFSQIEG